MKISTNVAMKVPGRRRESGMAVILVMAILAIVLVYIAGNLGTLHHLGRELRLLEQRQVRRLESLPKTNVVVLSATNAVANAKSQ